MRRRDFVKTSFLASASLMLPEFLRASAFNLYSFRGKRLVVIQLGGGNDGLNCVVPFRNDTYYSLRPDISLSGKNLIRLNDEAALNARLRGLADLVDDGHGAILNSVGYPNPNRSHFRSMDIWQSGSDPSEYLQSGWLGRVLDSTCNDHCAMPYAAVEIDDSLSLAMKGEHQKGIALHDIRTLKNAVANKMIRETATQIFNKDNSEISFLRKTLSETTQSVDYLSAHSSTWSSNSKYPDHEFGRQLKLVAELILSGSETMIYYVSLPGFDTHALQNRIQNPLLKIYADGIHTFCKDLKAAGELQNTLMLTFSEFGRRVSQNGSHGTDHGTANNIYLAGGSLRKSGLLNPMSDLDDLDEGDLKFKIDFRSVYATVIENWLGMDSKAILGKSFPLLDFI